jgi:FkbM family methyltransferase
MVRKIGFDVVKYPASKFRTIPVFDLSVQFLMSSHGPNLSFIQIGANDGCLGDPLRKYILNFPWYGILVEPQPDVFATLRKNYDTVKDRLVFENIAIAETVSEVTMYKANTGYAGNSAYAASVVSVNPRVTAKQLGIKQTDLQQFSVPSCTLNKLISKHDISNLDILQIDVEGHDYNVLKTIDLSKTTPRIVQLETGHLSTNDLNNAVRYLSRNGYCILYTSQLDTIALHETFPLSVA